MQRIDIWIYGEAGRDQPLQGLLRALRKAGIVARPRQTKTRESNDLTNLLMWQSVDDPLDRARALGAGVGDVVGPWMHPAEALARSLRFARAISSGEGRSGSAQLRLGVLEIDLIEREAWREGRTLGLLRREFELLHLLARRAGVPQSRETLLRDIWRLGFDPGTNVVEVHVSRLRAKLDRGFDWQMLRTVRGAGYALVPAIVAE